MIQGTRGGQRCISFDCPCSFSFKRTSRRTTCPERRVVPPFLAHLPQSVCTEQEERGSPRLRPLVLYFSFVRRSSRTSSTTSPFRLSFLFRKTENKSESSLSSFLKTKFSLFSPFYIFATGYSS